MLNFPLIIGGSLSAQKEKRVKTGSTFKSPTTTPNGIMDPKAFAQQIPSSRLSAGIGKRISDIVAIFPNGEPTDPSRLCLREQVNRSERKVFTTSSLAAGPSSKPIEIKHVGIEETAGDGFEYVLAVVDRTTGRPIEFRPTALVNFQPRFKPSEELLNGKKRKSVVDYSQDFSVEREEYFAERNRLTKSFGSVKKNKMLEAHRRRSITNDTLEAMSTTAFASPTTPINTSKGEVIDETPNLKDEDKSKLLTILERGSSGTLPVPNYDAKVPADVYKIEQFLPTDFDEKRSEFESESLRFFQENNSYPVLVQAGISPMIAKRVGTPMRCANPGMRCTVALKMIALGKLVQHCYKVKHRSFITASELDAFSLTPHMFEHFRTTYLGEKTAARNSVKIQIANAKKIRALADLLCLMLVFDEPDFILPLSPLVQELGAGEVVLKRFLLGLGCVVSTATETQSLTLNTMRVARLVGPPRKESGLVSAAKKSGRGMASKRGR